MDRTLGAKNGKKNKKKQKLLQSVSEEDGLHFARLFERLHTKSGYLMIR